MPFWVLQHLLIITTSAVIIVLVVCDMLHKSCIIWHAKRPRTIVTSLIVTSLALPGWNESTCFWWNQVIVEMMTIAFIYNVFRQFGGVCVSEFVAEL